MRVKHALAATAAGLGAMGTVAGVGAFVLGKTLWNRYREKVDFRGQVVAITGGSRGLGFALALEFAQRGAKLAICARDEETLREAEHRLHAYGAEVLAVRFDVSHQHQAESFIRQVEERFGRIDVLVNNAGTISVGPFEAQRLEDFEDAMATMYWGVVYTTLAAYPGMQRRRSGHITNITSIGGKVAIPHLLPYSGAKFAAVGFSEGLRSEVAKDGIKVTTIVPGLMRTGSHMNALFKGDHHKEYAWFSLGATLPVVAMNAHRAARKIVDATARGAAELVLTPQAKLLALAHGIAPGVIADALGVSNRLMPGTGSRHPQRFTGKESETPMTRSFVTAMGRKAGHELNQHPYSGPVGGDADASSRPLRPRVVRQNPQALPSD
jgi:short-subunit dehydrogenase